jgi:hypothetical protein
MRSSAPSVAIVRISAIADSDFTLMADTISR